MTSSFLRGERRNAQRVALCLRGMANMHHVVRDNIKANVIDALGVEDVYVSTYEYDKIDEFKEFYKPCHIRLHTHSRDTRDVYHMIRLHTLDCLNAMVRSEKQYDYVIVTRPDASFEFDFARLFEEKAIGTASIDNR